MSTPTRDEVSVSKERLIEKHLEYPTENGHISLLKCSAVTFSIPEMVYRMMAFCSFRLTSDVSN
jgi:hypothetical protein